MDGNQGWHRFNQIDLITLKKSKYRVLNVNVASDSDSYEDETNQATNNE